ncbi:EAL domain-containing protein [Thiocystis violacea]|uniref:EAL domain-containing protein n=1 Tax=Thiocystis violacea TaxID=13725 RepID=UPI001907E043|nr:EAL domain-containing protein [Thiocystis violacea]MBK1722317.1 diguanylate phosphodiesterase [Thiocystis violacea]
MNKVKKILCIHPEPAELRISALLNRQGIAVDLTEASRADAITAALAQPQWWDLILCDADTFFEKDIASRFDPVQGRIDASLVLLKSASSGPTPVEGYGCGAADVVDRQDVDHLLMVCEREIKNAVTRKQLRQLRHSVAVPDADGGVHVALATIKDLAKSASSAGAGAAGEDAGASEPLALDRIRSLIDAGGLVLEYQPIISFKANEEHRNMFETLVRLKDESGRMLLPDSFLPIAATAGWMPRIDLWICRQAIAVLEQMQAGGARDATLFVNLANETLRSEQQVRAIGAFVTAAHLAPGSIVVEVRKSAFLEAAEGLNRLASMLQVKRHGLLVEDPKLDDCEFLEARRGLITHVKLSRATTQGLVEGSASQLALNNFVRCAHKEGMRVIALAVESADLLPILFAAGVNAIQGNFTSMPNQELMYPSVRMIDSGLFG